MPTVLWHLPPEYSHLSAPRLLGTQLVAQGWRVVCLSELDMQPHVEAAGFEYVPYLPEVYPKGMLEARDRLSASETWDWWYGRDLAMWQEASSGRLEATVASVRPDVIWVDQINPDTLLIAHKLQIPVIRVSCMLPLYHEPDVPPMWSDALPGELSKWELEVEWMCHAALLHRQPWIERDNPIKSGEFFRFVQSCGLHIAQINYRSSFNYHVESDPEMITCSQVFDFPRPGVPNRIYLGPCLTETVAPPWTYPARRPDAPLIYCSFGSKVAGYPAARGVLRRLIETARARPELDVVIAAVPDDILGSYEIPPTVHTVRWAPQREVLREADLFISHAGLNSIRESIWEGVPLLAVPQAHDQRGVAARVVHHGIGERIVGEIPSTAVFMAAIDRLLGDPAYRQAAERMGAVFKADAQHEVGTAFVTDVAERRIAARPAAYFEQVTQRLYRAIMGDEQA